MLPAGTQGAARVTQDVRGDGDEVDGEDAHLADGEAFVFPFSHWRSH